VTGLAHEAEDLDLLRVRREHADQHHRPRDGQRHYQHQPGRGQRAQGVAGAEAHEHADGQQQRDRPGLLDQVGDDPARQQGEPGHR
jgi:hypothetical protein